MELFILCLVLLVAMATVDLPHQGARVEARIRLHDAFGCRYGKHHRNQLM